MTNWHPRPETVEPGRWLGVAWIIAAVAAWMVTPMLWLLLAAGMGWGMDCSEPVGAGDLPPGCPREGLLAGMAMLSLALWILGTAVVAFVVGVLEGRHRRFAYHRRTCAVLVTVAMPWAMLTYAAGNGLGRLFPVPAANSIGTPQYG
jgi:hypothetical protein